MAEHADVPGGIFPALRNVLWGVVVFIALLEAADTLRVGHYLSSVEWLFAALVALAVAVIWQRFAAQHERVQLTIEKVRFDLNFMYVTLTLINRGTDTALRNWRATYSARRGPLQELRVTDFRTDTGTTSMGIGTTSAESYDNYGNYVGPLVPVTTFETLIDKRLEHGGRRTGNLTIFGKDLVVSAGAKLNIAVDDVHGHTIRASFAFPAAFSR